MKKIEIEKIKILLHNFNEMTPIEKLGWLVYRIGLVGSLMSIMTFLSTLTLLVNLIATYLGYSTWKLMAIITPFMFVGLIILGHILWKNKYQDVLNDQANQKNPQLMELIKDVKEIKEELKCTKRQSEQGKENLN